MTHDPFCHKNKTWFAKINISFCQVTKLCLYDNLHIFIYLKEAQIFFFFVFHKFSPIKIMILETCHVTLNINIIFIYSAWNSTHFHRAQLQLVRHIHIHLFLFLVWRHIHVQFFNFFFGQRHIHIIIGTRLISLK